jgi:hypothetical protein
VQILDSDGSGDLSSQEFQAAIKKLVSDGGCPHPIPFSNWKLAITPEFSFSSMPEGLL